MSTPPKTSSYYSSYFLLLALVLSLVLHGILVFWAPTESNFIQSGSATRMNISMHSVENEPAKTTNTNVKKAVQKTPEKPVPKRKPEVAEPQKVQTKILEPKPVENKTLEQKIMSVSKPQSTNVIQQASIDTVQKQAEPLTPKETQVKQVSEEVEVKETGLAINKVDEKTPQPVRYELGSNDNPKPKYPHLAFKKGWQAEIVLGVHVKSDGTIEHLTFIKSSDYGVLNYEAYETVRTSWRFKPLSIEYNSSKPAIIEVPIVFNIED